MAKTKTKKFSMDALKAKPYKLPITLPGHDEPTTWLMIKGAHAFDFQNATAEAQKVVAKMDEDESATIEDVLLIRASVLAILVVGWDEDTLGEYSEDNVLELLSHEDSFHILNAIEECAKDSATFFKTEGTRSTPKAY